MWASEGDSASSNYLNELTLFPGKGTINNSSNILLPSSTVAHHLYCFLNPFRTTSAVCLSQPGRCKRDHLLPTTMAATKMCGYKLCIVEAQEPYYFLIPAMWLQVMYVFRVNRVVRVMVAVVDVNIHWSQQISLLHLIPWLSSSDTKKWLCKISLVQVWKH